MSNNNKNQQIKTPLDLITKPYNKNVVTVTDTYQLKYQFQYNTSDRANRYWNNEGDAFKHTYMQADLSFKFGRPIASIPGYWHEAQNLFKGNSKNETNMDLWNNKIGRQIGQEVLKEMREKHKLGEKKKWKEIDDAIAEKIMQKMRNDELITSPDDPRARTLIEKFKNNSKIPKNWQEYLNTPKDFSKLQPSKLDELQQEKFKEFMKEFAPVISVEEDEANPYQQLLGGQKNKKDPKLPVLLEKTRQDEELIISIIADAWKCNRLGFRNILRYE